MRVLYVNSGPSEPHESIDRYIHLTLSKMGIEYKLFDLAAHLEFFSRAFKFMEREYGAQSTISTMLKYIASPLLQVVSEYEPDLVLTMHGGNLPAEIVRSIRKLGIATAVWIVDDPYEIDQSIHYAAAYDYVFTVESSVVAIYREFGCESVFHLPLAAFDGVYKDRPVAPRFESDVCFIGSGFYNRLDFFDAIADYLIDSGLRIRIIGWWWDGLKSFYKLRKFISSELVHAADAAKYYAGAKINLNIHRASDAAAHFGGNTRKIKAISPNNRTFEIVSCGGFQLVDGTRPDLSDYFEVGKEVDVFSSPEELIEKIDFYIKNEDIRKGMAKSAMDRCVKEHTFRDRLQFILASVMEAKHREASNQITMLKN